MLAAMPHFGFATWIDLLSWTIAGVLGAKVLATVILLAVNRDARDQPGWGSILWWVTKITPLIAVPCLIGLALLERDQSLLQLSLGLALFVIIAVPLVVRHRRRRIARYSAASLRTVCGETRTSPESSNR